MPCRLAIIEASSTGYHERHHALVFRLEGEALDRYRAYAGDGVFRFSVGIEDADDICADLDQCCERRFWRKAGLITALSRYRT